MDIINILNVGLTIIGAATVFLNVVAPITKWKGDDKILAFLKRILEVLALNVDDKGDTKIEVLIKQK